jgi:membrane-associated phospholipid phosphatase
MNPLNPHLPGHVSLRQACGCLYPQLCSDAARRRWCARTRIAWPGMGERTSGQILTSPGRSAGRPLLPAAARPSAVVIVATCVLVLTVQAVWIRHGMETSWLDATVDAKVVAGLGGHPLLLAMLVWPGEPVPFTGIAAVLALACVLQRRYDGAVLVAISAPLAVAITELVLKPVIGGTSWGNPFPSGHVTSVAALATALTVLLARVPRRLCLVLVCTAFLVTGAVALGVIGARMHHFSDTVGGAAVGIGVVLATALILDLLFSMRQGFGALARVSLVLASIVRADTPQRSFALTASGGGSRDRRHAGMTRSRTSAVVRTVPVPTAAPATASVK